MVHSGVHRDYYLNVHTGLPVMERLKARPSLSHLADRFNTAPPPGYVAGRGRGVSGFSKPDPADLPKGRGAGSSSAELQAAAASTDPAEDDHKLRLGAGSLTEPENQPLGSRQRHCVRCRALLCADVR